MGRLLALGDRQRQLVEGGYGRLMKVVLVWIGVQITRILVTVLNNNNRRSVHAMRLIGSLQF